MSRISTRFGSGNTTACVFILRGPLLAGTGSNVGTISCLPRRTGRAAREASMKWYRQVQFVSSVGLPPEEVEAFGTPVNGMWADPEGHSADDVTAAHERDRRVLFSVPMIALTPHVYEATPALVEEVCSDIDGKPSECDWYYWESKPVFAACIYSQAFRDYLMERCRLGVDREM